MKSLAVNLFYVFKNTSWLGRLNTNVTTLRQMKDSTMSKHSCPRYKSYTAQTDKVMQGYLNYTVR